MISATFVARVQRMDGSTLQAFSAGKLMQVWAHGSMPASRAQKSHMSSQNNLKVKIKEKQYE